MVDPLDQLLKPIMSLLLEQLTVVIQDLHLIQEEVLQVL
jgi:hypothetical protein